MGRQAYITQMALGRSAFQPLPDTLSDEDSGPDLVDEPSPEHQFGQTERASLENATETQDHVAEPVVDSTPLVRTSQYEQQYDSRGYPENAASRAMARQSRRAMNDVLATVGVCVGVDADGQKMTINDRSRPSFDRATIDSITMENEIGLVVDSVDMMLVSLASMFTIGFRQGLQTFRFYTGIPMTTIARRESRHFSSLKYFLAGAPAALTYSALNITRSWAIETLSVSILVRLYENLKSPKYRNVMLWLLETAERLLYGASFVFLAPFQMYATLQRLNLLPGWPLFPHPRAFLPFSASSPLKIPALPTLLTFGSGLEFLASLAFSPLFLWCIVAWSKPQINNKLRAYMRAALPKPHYPDRYSLQAAKEDELDNDSVPGLCNDPDGDKSEWESASVLEELAKDLQYIGKKYAIFYDKCKRCMSRRPGDSHKTVRPQPQPERIETRPRHINESMGTFSVPSPLPSSSSSSSTSIPTPSSRPTTPHPQIEIITSTAGSGTLYMDIEIPHPNPPEQPFFSNDLSNPPLHSELDTQINNETKSRQNSRNQQVHRITALSAYAADALATHLAAHLTDIIFLPIEALFVRSLALAFLASPRANPAAQAAAARLRGEVFPLGSWCGMGLRGGWRGLGDYVGKMVLVSGLEMGIGMVVWQACTGFAWMSGRRWFSWGAMSRKSWFS